MLNTIFSLFLLLMPGFIAAEYWRYLNHEKRSTDLGLLSDTLIFSFIILGLNAAFKYLKGGSAEVFQITEIPYNTSFLTKYIALSVVFSFLLPHIVQLFDLMMKHLKARNHEK